jgi:hypothetical protein
MKELESELAVIVKVSIVLETVMVWLLEMFEKV